MRFYIIGFKCSRFVCILCVCGENHGVVKLLSFQLEKKQSSGLKTSDSFFSCDKYINICSSGIHVISVLQPSDGRWEELGTVPLPTQKKEMIFNVSSHSFCLPVANIL